MADAASIVLGDTQPKPAYPLRKVGKRKKRRHSKLPRCIIQDRRGHLYLRSVWVKRAIGKSSIRIEDVEEGLRLLHLYKLHCREGVPLPERAIRRESVTVATILDNFLNHGRITHKVSQDEDEARSKIWRERIGNERLSADNRSVLRKKIHKILHELPTAGYATSTTNRFAALIRAGMNMAVRDELIKPDENPCAGGMPRFEERRRLGFLTRERELELRDVVPAPLKPFVKFAVNTGRRAGELLRLVRPNMDLKGRQYYAELEKGGVTGWYPLNNEAYDALVEMIALLEPGEERIFPFNYDWAYRELKKGFRAIGNPVKNPIHIFRHTFGTRLAEAGANAFTIQRLMGLKTLAVAQWYVEITDKAGRRALDSIVAPALEAAESESE